MHLGIWLPLTLHSSVRFLRTVLCGFGTLTHKGALLCLLRAVLWHFHSQGLTFTHKGSLSLTRAPRCFVRLRHAHSQGRSTVFLDVLSPVAVSRMGPAKDVLLSSTCPGVNFRVHSCWVSTRDGLPQLYRCFSRYFPIFPTLLSQ